MSAFTCDEVFSGIYDELMSVVDPDVSHTQWLTQIVKHRQPARILDVGAGTGRLAKEVSKRFPSSQLTAIEPDEIFFELLSTSSIDAEFANLIDFSKKNASIFDFAYAAYGSLQYVRNIAEIGDNLRALSGVLTPNAMVALEFFSAETYLSISDEVSVPIYLKREIWDFTMKISFHEENRITVDSSVWRRSDGQTGHMSETIVPVSSRECYELLSDAGFEKIDVVSGGAYHRSSAIKK